jgi:hypothetical protein
MANLKTHESFNPGQRWCAGVLVESSRGESACPATVQGDASAQKSSKEDSVAVVNQGKGGMYQGKACCAVLCRSKGHC